MKCDMPTQHHARSPRSRQPPSLPPPPLKSSKNNRFTAPQRRGGWRRQLGLLLSLGTLVLLAAPGQAGAQEDETGGIPGFACYRTVEETYADAQALATTAPSLAEWIDVGDSWKKTQDSADGYDLMVLRLTNEGRTGPKPRLFVVSALHAREYTTAELTTRFAEQLVAGYGTDADATWLLDHHEVHLLLHANPDGRKRAEEGLLWRKNHNRNHCPMGGPPSSLMGVDLNRNFDFEWEWKEEGSIPTACDRQFRGPSAASEPETQAIQKYLRDLFPDVRGEADTDAAPDGASGVFLDIHSPGRRVQWPWGYTKETAPNAAQLQTLGRKLAFFNGHWPRQTSGGPVSPYLPVIRGTAIDYAYGTLGVASYLFELGGWFFESCSSFERTILAGNLRALHYALKAARAPYTIPAGPDVFDITLSAGASPGGVPAGTPITLSATFSDTRYSNQDGTEPTQAIAAGEYYVDVPPWGENPAARTMTAADGAFGYMTEEATARIDTTGWRLGRHIVFVRARDADGNWGAVSAAFVYIGLPAPTNLRVTASNEQLDLSWTAPPGLVVTGYDVHYKIDTAADHLATTPADPTTGWVAVSRSDTPLSQAQAITGLTNGTAYAVRVRAKTADGNGAWATGRGEPRTGGDSHIGGSGTGTDSDTGTGVGGGGGGRTASRDRHGNTPAQATPIRLRTTAPWRSTTPGEINTFRDRDYFRLSVPHAGILVVETTGATDTVGTVWQAGEELGTATDGGPRTNFRLRVPVAAGPVVIAVTGNRGRTGRYSLRTRLLVGVLENPAPASFQSGLGVISGWVCAAEAVEIELNGQRQPAAIGTARADTAPTCGHSATGFGLLFNWNLLGDGEHEVVAFVDDVRRRHRTGARDSDGDDLGGGGGGRCGGNV